ncbi:SusC/RagA family TonB-linked outer membrane protein [Mariniphaga sediminis]|uniref:SusC/RagA family TonB-linked outer membrane protein n=2 Tax=Mariniphaga sediminis TaxID=1628158 RepID=A0A399CUZ9_9BACT|nr:SusC/RagA family TonB-linked outer membrane protein [Mariniphaga sediminis]
MKKKWFLKDYSYLFNSCRKIVKIMRLSVFLIILTSLQSIALDSFPQRLKFNVNIENESLSNALKLIERESGYFLFYNNKVINLEKVVSLNLTNKSVTEVLDELFERTDVTYTIIGDKQIVLSKKSGETKLSQQQKNVSGKVTDFGGQPLPGVTVVVKGTTQGTVTNADGEYFLSSVPVDATLVFSFVGMKTQELVVSNQTVINVTMEEETIGLEEVVAVGYGTQKKINLTGAVGVVDSEQLEKRPVANITNALQGITPGLNITPNSRYGGEPGASMDFNIRGVGSLSGGAPYVLVDGMPMNIDNVNPDDVKSISVLKDAAASAIYGSRATYGVILITTKSGGVDMKMNTSYSNSFSWLAPAVLPEGVNSLVFAAKMNEAAINSGQNKLFSDETIERMKKYQADPDNFPSMIPDPNDPNGWGYWTLANGNTDWYDVYFKDRTFSQKHNLSITGGGTNSTYYVGLGWNDDGGKLNYANEKYQRYNLTSNFSLNVTDWMLISLKSKFSRSYKKYPQSSESSTNREAIFGMLARNWPNYPIYTPNGDYAMDLNQVPALANGGSDRQYSTDLWISPSVVLELTKDLKVNADFSYNAIGSKRNNFRAIIQGFAVDGVTPVRHYAQNYNRIEQTSSFYEYYTSNIFIDFTKDINKHAFAVIVGGQSESSNNFSINGWRRDLITEAVPAISTATGDKDVGDSMSHWSTLGAFARLTYNFDEKYLLELNGRYDGSSRFQSGRRWGFFPSASVGYNIWKENFWESLSNVINTLKLRTSYGALGNQNVENYLHVEVLPKNTNLAWIMDGRRPNYTTVPNNRSLGLTWEESKTVNLGMDAGFLNNRLNLSFDWFNRKTENMFGPGETLPAVFGANVPLKNNAVLKTNGFELALNWKQTVSNDFKYNINLVFSDNKSVVTKYNNPTKYIHNYYEGKTFGEIWGFETEGLFQTDQEASEWWDQSVLYSKWSAGDVKYKDLDGDEKITRGTQTVDNPGDLKVIGNSSPRYLYGINLNGNYKRFDFTMFWQGVGKKDVWMGNNPSFWGFQTAFWNSSLQGHNLDFWSLDNTDSYFPKPYLTSENSKNHEPSTRYIQDGSYIRLKNVQIGYTLPGSISSKVKTENIRIYCNAENMLTFSKIMESFDPEANFGLSNGLVYPLSKGFYVGINVTF